MKQRVALSEELTDIGDSWIPACTGMTTEGEDLSTSSFAKATDDKPVGMTGPENESLHSSCYTEKQCLCS